jgi:hypothetical protein
LPPDSIGADSERAKKAGRMPIDYKKYPPNWKTEIVPRILKRAKNKCESCGLENGQTVYSVPFKIAALDRKGKTKYVTRRIWFSHVGDALRETHNLKSIKTVTVVLTVAHLDHDADNHNVQDNRLRALCQACHLRLDAVPKWEKQTKERKI